VTPRSSPELDAARGILLGIGIMVLVLAGLALVWWLA